MAQSAPMAENVASALCYALMLITGILFLILEPYNKNRNIRFHAFQAIFISVALFAIRIVMLIIFSAMWSIGGLFFLSSIWMLFWLACMILWVYMIVTAYQGKKVVLPIIGPLAEKQA